MQLLRTTDVTQLSEDTLVNAISGSFCESLVAPFHRGELVMPEGSLPALGESVTAAAQADRAASLAMASAVESFATKPLVSFDYSLFRLDKGSDYSQMGTRRRRPLALSRRLRPGRERRCFVESRAFSRARSRTPARLFGNAFVGEELGQSPLLASTHGKEFGAGSSLTGG